MQRTQNGNVEKQRLVSMVRDFNLKLSSNDKTFANKVTSAWNIDPNDIERFVVAGGSSKHFDIIIQFKNGTTKNIEHKGIVGSGDNNDSERPWSLTPQLLNAPYNFTPISREYCKLWHQSFMPLLREYYPQLPEVPSYEIFLRDDASMGSAKSDFGKALKAIRDESQKNYDFIKLVEKISFQYFYQYIVNSDLVEQLKIDCEIKLQQILGEKNYWINAYYPTSDTTDTDTYFMSVTPTLSNLTIQLVQNTKGVTKIQLHYNLSSNSTRRFQGHSLLRWRNGKGISNVSWNIS